MDGSKTNVWEVKKKLLGGQKKFGRGDGHFFFWPLNKNFERGFNTFCHFFFFFFFFYIFFFFFFWGGGGEGWLGIGSVISFCFSLWLSLLLSSGCLCVCSCGHFNGCLHGWLFCCLNTVENPPPPTPNNIYLFKVVKHCSRN